MKKLIAVIVLAALLMSGCSALLPMQQQAEEQPTVEDMLAQALTLSDAGNYEEAILLYEAVIEIEPNNYEAGYGLGHAYRRTGRTADAIEVLKNTSKLSEEDKRALYELGYAYLDAGRYADARDVVSSEPTGADMAPEVGVLLVLSYSAEGEYERAVELLQDSSVRKIFSRFIGDDVLYFGKFDENGRKTGRGIGVYSGGEYIYCGEYKNDVRSGHGIWLVGKSSEGNNITYYEGEWANDMPNGYGEFYLCYIDQGLNVVRSGNYTDGLENGNMTVSFDDHAASYTSKNGVRALTGDEYSAEGSETAYYYAICKTHDGQCEGNWVIWEHQVGIRWGIEPWGKRKG